MSLNPSNALASPNFAFLAKHDELAFALALVEETEQRAAAETLLLGEELAKAIAAPEQVQAKIKLAVVAGDNLDLDEAATRRLIDAQLIEAFNRVVCQAQFMVNRIKPQAGEVIQDPAAGTGGFLVQADRYIKAHTDELFNLKERQQVFQKREALVGIELVPDAHRLLLMNAIFRQTDAVNTPALRGFRKGLWRRLARQIKTQGPGRGRSIPLFYPRADRRPRRQPRHQLASRRERDTYGGSTRTR